MLGKKKQDKKEDKPKKKELKITTPEEIANFPSGKFAPIYTDNTFVVKRNVETGKKEGAIKLDDLLEFLGVEF